MKIKKEGEATIPGMVMIESDERITKLLELVEDVHKAGAPIICQIAHCGKNGVAGKNFNVNRISEKTIERVIHDFSRAAIRAKKAGFDGVELHLAHSLENWGVNAIEVFCGIDWKQMGPAKGKIPVCQTGIVYFVATIHIQCLFVFVYVFISVKPAFFKAAAS